MTLFEIKNHALLTDFYFHNHLEINSSWVNESKNIISYANCEDIELADGKNCLYAMSISLKFGFFILDYIAVDSSLRGQQIGSQMLNFLKKQLCDNGVFEFFFTARAPIFFEKNDALPLPENHYLYDKLLRDCSLCDQYHAGCSPIAMRIFTS